MITKYPAPPYQGPAHEHVPSAGDAEVCAVCSNYHTNPTHTRHPDGILAGRLPVYPRDCNEARHLYVGDCCDHGSRCPCHVHTPSKLFRDHSQHVYEWLQHSYEHSGLDGPEPGTADYDRAPIDPRPIIEYWKGSN